MNGVKEDWDGMAQAYEEFNTAPDSYSRQIEWPAVRALLPDVAGKTVLDVGCGTGIFTFLLEELGPSRLVGLDLSGAMLDIARKKAAARGSKAVFLQGDAACTDRCVEGSFDLIFSSTTTHYIGDLPAFFGSLEKRLAPGGTVLLSLIHPVYSAQYPLAHGDTFPEDGEWRVRYLDQSVRAYVQPWLEYGGQYEDRLSRSCHHLFSDYLNAIAAAGLKVCRVEEPLPPASWKRDCPGRYEGYLETPVYLLLKLTR